MTINVGDLAGGGGAGFQLAPDLGWPNDTSNPANGWEQIITNCPAGVETTMLSLTGKFAISALIYKNMISESKNFKLTIDGVAIWDATRATSGTNLNLLGVGGSQLNSSTAINDIVIFCNTSLLLQITSTSTDSIDLQYLARPIL